MNPTNTISIARSLRLHWHLYVFEAVELASFMLSACAFSVLLFDPSPRTLHVLPSAAVRQMLFGVIMGAIAILIILSPIGKRSGAHFNPACTLTYLRLGKIARTDATFYVISQFIGGILGVGLAALIFTKSIALPTVDYAVSVPGTDGTAVAFLAELFMGSYLWAQCFGRQITPGSQGQPPTWSDF